jgi:signal transduction histidine kinase
MSDIDNENAEPDLNKLRKDFVAHLNNMDPYVALQELLNSLPSAAAILDSQRRAIFVNYFLLSSLGVDSFEILFGKRPGEILSCLHALENEDQCGVSESCKACGALLALKKSQATNEISIAEMRLTAIQRGIFIARDFKITISPLLLNENAYMIMYLNDISNDKRRLVLERIFFHDVLNKVSSLQGMIGILNPKNRMDKYDEMMSTVKLIVSDITTEITSHRQLLAAENGDLELNIEPIGLSILINRIVDQAKLFRSLSDINISIEMDDKNTKISSDQTILNRIITNMLKNAIEASGKNDSVKISTYKEANNQIIAVHNQSAIPEDDQVQIFHRSFSTKGQDRGLGTYSIKLLTERYLQGKAYFQSDEQKGTTFYIKIPAKYKKGS